MSKETYTKKKSKKGLVSKTILALLVVFVFAYKGTSIGCKGGGENDISDPVTPENPPIEQEDTVFPIRENLVAVGLSSFPIGVLNFPRENNQQEEGIGYKTTARAVRYIYTNELWTFPEEPDPQLIKDTLKFFIDNGHRVLHEVHILNGPGMRGSSDRFVNGIVDEITGTTGNNVHNKEFTQLLFNNPAFQNKVLTEFAKVVTHCKELESFGVECYICPELEDNQDNGESSAFGIYLAFLKQAGWVNPDGSLRRSRVVRNGGSVGMISGIRYEAHSHSPQELAHRYLRPGDFVNMDGTSFYFNSNDNKPDFQMSEDDVRWMLQYCEEQNLIFGIWPSELQGLYQVQRFDYRPIGAYKARHYLLNNPIGMASILLKVTEQGLRDRLDSAS